MHLRGRGFDKFSIEEAEGGAEEIRACVDIVRAASIENTGSLAADDDQRIQVGVARKVRKADDDTMGAGCVSKGADGQERRLRSSAEPIANPVPG